MKDDFARNNCFKKILGYNYYGIYDNGGVSFVFEDRSVLKCKLEKWNYKEKYGNFICHKDGSSHDLYIKN
jgi:hypothetical protein